MSMANKKVLQVDHNFRNQKGHAPSFSSALASRNRGEYSGQNSQTSRLDRLSLKVVWRKEEVGLLHVLSMVETTHEIVMMDQKVGTSVVKRVTSWESATRISKVVKIREIKLNLYQLIHQTWLNLENPRLVPTEG